jgi:hypothetical protein
MIVLLFVWLVVLLWTQFTSCDKTIYLHIGPHKTGSSHLQHFLSANQKELATKGYCWPILPDVGPRMRMTGKSLSRISSDIIETKQISSIVMKEINNCLVNNDTMILSAEDLSTFHSDQVQLLKSFLPEDNKIKIVIFFREFLSRVYSTFAEVTKKNGGKTTSFGQFLFRTFDTISHMNQIDTSALVTRWGNVFGGENIIVVDYDGVNAAGKDLAYVFVCEIMKTMCGDDQNEGGIWGGQVAHENEKPNILFLHLVYLVRFYVQTQGFSICSFDYPFITETLKLYEARRLTPPLLQSHLKVLQFFSKNMDSQFRYYHSSKILYSNETAAMKVLEGFTAEEVDEFSFYNDPNWMKFLKDEFWRLKKQNKLCSFTKPIMNPSNRTLR